MLKIGVNIIHAESLKLYQESTGAAFPAIPAGKNTVWHHFITQDGRPAVIINQRGFAPRADDNEQECNGCAVAIALDDVPPAAAHADLEKWVRYMLEK